MQLCMECSKLDTYGSDYLKKHWKRKNKFRTKFVLLFTVYNSYWSSISYEHQCSSYLCRLLKFKLLPTLIINHAFCTFNVVLRVPRLPGGRLVRVERVQRVVRHRRNAAAQGRDQTSERRRPAVPAVAADQVVRERERLRSARAGALQVVTRRVLPGAAPNRVHPHPLPRQKRTPAAVTCTYNYLFKSPDNATLSQ